MVSINSNSENINLHDF